MIINNRKGFSTQISTILIFFISLFSTTSYAGKSLEIDYKNLADNVITDQDSHMSNDESCFGDCYEHGAGNINFTSLAHSPSMLVQSTRFTTKQALLWESIGYSLLLITFAAYLIRLHKKKLSFVSNQLEQKVFERTQELREANIRLQEISLKDQLTGTKNRHFIDEMIKQDLNRIFRVYQEANMLGTKPIKSDLIIFLVDLDHFKSVNDIYGHIVGDQVLVKVAQSLQGIFREYDYVVRWGGEEFLIIARFVNREHIVKLAEKIRIVIESLEFDVGQSLPLKATASVGAVPYPFSATQFDLLNWEQTVHIADIALYDAKANSRNTWVCYSANDNALPHNFYQILAEDQEKVIKSGLITVSQGYAKHN